MEESFDISSSLERLMLIADPNADSAAEERAGALENDNYSLWGVVRSTNYQSHAEDQDDDRSIILVSRASSPWSVEFRTLRTPSPAPLKIAWPPTLPWLQFQDLYLKKAVPQPWRQNTGRPDATTLLRAWRYHQLATAPRIPGDDNGEKMEEDEDGESEASFILDTDIDHGSEDDGNSGLDADALDTMLGWRALELASVDADFEQAGAELAKSIPEAYSGEHAAALQAIFMGNTNESKVAAFKILVYQVSNDLIEHDDELDNDNKYVRILDLFRAIGLLRDTWEEHFTSKRDRSSRAFAEKLFEAAVNAQDLELVGALLKSGVDPNRPITSFMNGTSERPVQIAADNRVANVQLVELLLKTGADANLTTSDNPRPALHKSAQRGTLEMVQMLVEHGASIYSKYDEGGYAWESTRTPLAMAADTWDFSADPKFPRQKSSDDADMGERESVKILRYLAGLHQKENRPSLDAILIQDAVLIAAGRSDPALIEVLHQAGGDVTKTNSHGITPLMVATSRYDGDTTVASYLLDHGAAVSSCTPHPSPLHFAAARGHRGMVALLIEKGAEINHSRRVDSRLHRDLLALGGDFNEDDGTGPSVRYWYTPLQLALHTREPSEQGLSRSFKSDGAASALLEAGAALVTGELILGVRFLSRRLVRALLDRGADPNETDSTGCSALQIALKTYHLRDGEGESLSGVLLGAGAVAAPGDLHLALAAGDMDLTRQLMAKAARLQHIGPNGQTLMEAGLLSHSRPLIDWLLYDIGLPYSSGALCAAVAYETRVPVHGERVMNTVRARRTSPQTTRIQFDILEVTAVSMAAFYSSGKQPRMLSKLLALGHLGKICVIPYRDEYRSYVDIIHRDWFEQLQTKYAERGWWRKADLIRCSPLVPALLTERASRRVVVRMLLRAGYRPDALTLAVAISRCTSDEIDELLRHAAVGLVNAAPRYDVDKPLQLAVRRGCVDIIRLLLRHGADVNGLSAVLVPVMYGGDPNEYKPRSALAQAVEKGDLEVIDVILAAGANVNGPIAMDGGATALQCAAATGFIGIAKTLIEAGADVNGLRAERYGRTALEAAAEWGRLDMVQYLLEMGADTESNRGRWQYLRAITFAERSGHEVVANLLREWRGPLARWQKRFLWYHEVLDEVFVAPDDILDEFYIRGRWNGGEDGDRDGEDDDGLDVDSNDEDEEEDSEGYDFDDNGDDGTNDIDEDGTDVLVST